MKDGNNRQRRIDKPNFATNLPSLDFDLGSCGNHRSHEPFLNWLDVISAFIACDISYMSSCVITLKQLMKGIEPFSAALMRSDGVFLQLEIACHEAKTQNPRRCVENAEQRNEAKLISAEGIVLFGAINDEFLVIPFDFARFGGATWRFSRHSLFRLGRGLVGPYIRRRLVGPYIGRRLVGLRCRFRHIELFECRLHKQRNRQSAHRSRVYRRIVFARCSLSRRAWRRFFRICRIGPL